MLRASLWFAFALSASLAAQRPLTHDDYDAWKSLRATAISQDGAWAAYQIEPQWGDGVLEVRQSTGDVVYRHPLGSGPRFSSDGRYCVFTVGKSKVEERQKKIDELRKKTKELKEGKPANAETPAGEGAGGGAAGGELPAGARGAFGGGRGGPGARGGFGGRGPGGAGGGDESSRERGDLAILDLASGKVEIVPKVKGFTLPDDAAVLIYHLDAPEPAKKDDAKPAEAGGEAKPAEKPAEPKAEEPKATEPKAGEPKAGEPKAEEPKPVAAEPAAPAGARGGEGAGRRGRRGGGGFGPGAGGPGGAPGAAPADPMERKRKDGSTLVVRDLVAGGERRIDDVVTYGLTRKNAWLWYHTSAKKPDSKKSYGLFATRLDGSLTHTVVDGFADFSGMTSDRKGIAIAFTSNKDDFAAEKPRSDIWLWNGDAKPAERIVYPGSPGMPAGKLPGGGVSFSRDGSTLVLSVQDPPEAELPPILPEEKVALDIWHWNDGELQTQQSKRGRRDGNWTAVWHRGERRLQVVGNARVEQVRTITPDGSRGIGSDDQPYEKLTQWDGRYADVWLVNTVDGSRQKVLEKLRGNVTNSPTGRWLIWFGADYHWWTLDVATQQKRDLTGALPVAFHNVDDDHPEPDPAYGIAGWTEQDASVLLYDEFDVWQVNPATGDAVCVTDGFGRSNKLRLRIQPVPRDDDEDGALPNDLLLAATDTETMAEGFYRDVIGTLQKPQRLVQMDKNLGDLRKAKKADRWFLTIGSFREYPDLWTCDAQFGSMRKLSDANPQQKEFRWGNAELVHWINGDGVRLAGILVKPDGFDPKKKYPMLVNFYEKSSQGLHNYVAPAPGTSPNAAYYVSNGYLWFMPDIVYDVGYPGESCVKCVVAGVQSLIAQGFVDEKAIGAAGHSWGGYQTAFLVTRTNIFAAVESGAPVSNMISAYGGIRYESGVSRQFQYEQTQSRIGGTPWSHPLRYWENSPIFFADKVKTPVLILHNDNDGAVPWTNGIEYFTALKRLGKEAYLFNYNGEPHGLTKRPNTKDWARRMAEYFDHHLKHAPMPKWMQDGVPFSERDREKLPFTKSYLEAQVEPSTKQAIEAPATRPNPAIGDPQKTESKGDVGAQEPKPAAKPATQEPKPVGKPVEAGAKPGDKPQGGETPKPAAKPAEKPAEKPAATPASEPVTKPAEKPSRPVLAPGKPAPDFAVADESGKVHKLADYRGKTLVVYFYPKADTPGCTAEGCAFRDQQKEFAQKNAAIVGVSFDDAAANKAFKDKFTFPFPLLCDTDKAMAIAYGAADDKDAKVARRAACVVGPDGNIVKWYAKVDAKTFATTVLGELPAK